MTAKHILDGLMQMTKARSHSHFSTILGIDAATVSRLYNGKSTGMNIGTVDILQRKTGVPLETLFAWYRLPDGAVLGRVSDQAE